MEVPVAVGVRFSCKKLIQKILYYEVITSLFYFYIDSKKERNTTAVLKITIPIGGRLRSV